MTPIKWVYEYYDEPQPEVTQANGVIRVPVPMVPLDALAAWLEHEQATHIATARYGAFAYLLAQVQAWKEKP